MCRSVYLSGLLMSHGTDSVRTRRATIARRQRGKAKLHETYLKIKVGENGQTALNASICYHVTALLARKKKFPLANHVIEEICQFLAAMQSRESLISVLTLGSSLVVFFWREAGGGKEKTKSNIESRKKL